MNKKVIAMAVAAGMVAPLAAQADVKMSGRVQQEIVNGSAGLGMQDNGHARLQFDYSDDSGMFGRLAMDGRANKLDTARDIYVGLKAGPGKLSWGRQAGAVKNIEKDPFIATFLELRNNAVAGGSYGSSSFNDDIIAYKMKMGGAKLNLQYGIGGSDGHLGLGLKGGDSLKWYVGYNNGDGTTGGVTKAGVYMPLGGMNLRVGYDSEDGGAAKTHLGVDMKMAGGMLDVTFADKGFDTTAAYYRVAYKKKNSKNISTHAGIVQNGNKDAGAMSIGVGVVVKF